MVKAWQNLDRFEGRASLKTWLYRIATNVCLDTLSDRSRRFRPMEEGDAGSPEDPLITRPRNYWVEPIPDARAVPADASPLEKTMLRQSIRLAFVAALAASAAAAARRAAADGSARMVGGGSGGMRGHDGRGRQQRAAARAGDACQPQREPRRSRRAGAGARRALRRCVPSLRRRGARVVAARRRGDVHAAVFVLAPWPRVHPRVARTDAVRSAAGRSSCRSRRPARWRSVNIMPPSPAAHISPGASWCSRAWMDASCRGTRSSTPRRCFQSSGFRPACPPRPIPTPTDDFRDARESMSPDFIFVEAL